MRWPGWDCQRTTFRNSPVHAVRALSLAKARARDDARSRAGGELFPDLDAFPIPPRPQFLRSSQGDLASPIAVPGVACLGINLDSVIKFNSHGDTPPFPYMSLECHRIT